MDAARQVLRYSIPGSIFLLDLIVCHFVLRAFQGESLGQALAPIRDNVGAVVAIVSTIPIGFVVYQCYFLSYTPTLRLYPFPWCGRLVRFDRGWQILSALSPEQRSFLGQLFDGEIVPAGPCVFVGEGDRERSWLLRAEQKLRLLELTGEITQLPNKPERRAAFEEQWHFNWNVVKATVEIAGSNPDESQIKTEYTSLSDIYHSLGATKTAVLLGWLIVTAVGVLHFGRIINDPFGTLGGLAFLTLLSAALYLALHTVRARTWLSAAQSLRLGLRWYFFRHGDELTGFSGQ
jgi:hypothetical protein